MVSKLALVWGIGGVVALLSTAVFRMWGMAVESFSVDLTWVHYLGYAGSLAFLGYVEGYKSFQKQFSPRVVARALYLSEQPTGLRVLLAPAFCMGFFHATRKRLIVSWTVALGVVGLVMIVSRLPQPWRGIIDLGVVVGLSWGIVAILAYAWAAFRGQTLPVASDVPAMGPA